MKKFTAEEKKAYYAEQKKQVEQALVAGVQHCFADGSNFRSYLDTMSKFHNYSLRNCMLIAMQMPTATHIAGYGDWNKKFKRHVKTGEKSIKVIAPTPCKFKVKDIDTDGNEIEKEITVNRYKVVPVFDVSQTEGEDLPTLCKPLTADVEGFDSIRKTLEGSAKYPVSYETIDDEDLYGWFDTRNKKIVISAGVSEAQTIKTLVHEIAHSILHDDVFCQIPREIKEVQAESVAYIVCSNLGINTDQYSFEYVAAWSQQDPKALNDQLDIVRRTADAILDKFN